jgi:antitoxin component YwqK of YwqJK toxin-antitoxin module
MWWDRKTGQIRGLSFEDHNVSNGPSLGWYPNGQLRYSIVWLAGEMEGPSTHWYPNGEVSFRGFHHNGQLDGTWEQYDESGQLISVKRYAKGKVVQEGGSSTSEEAQPTP